MSTLQTEDSYIIRKVTNQDKESVLLYLQKYFYTDEPLNKYLSNGADVCKNRGQASINAIDSELSLMAVAQSTNEIVGVSINDYYKAKSVPVDDHPNVMKVFRIIQKLEEESADLARLKKADGKELTVKQICVHPNWRNKRIGLNLLKHTRALAKEKGFSQLRSVCTSAYSTQIFEKLGFQCIHSIKYEDYKKDGKIVFKPGFPHTHIKLMIVEM